MWDRGRYFWQPETLAAARWLREETPPDTHVVGFNVGVLSFFDDRTTTNLDGVMNPQALRALEDRRLLAYVDSLDADYVVDYESYVFFYQLYWGGRVRSRLDPISSFQSPERVLFGSYRIYRFY